ncbi:MarR family winged helix-turn-helix transcriptional regulator [Streptacidiphilus jiangxiensis]|uniref:DNA-binding transcriptional regulator, MarR family n=1 Tax=Streptacidiphilus jiangxiensis TaxID=235985 RepID=A0A1H7ZE31_STRJI|nr:MarR family winged helix-turn-helix transcriptional regulator [Streptacidiphilus jiangxiensis]SEM55788.1 DNA-binding transcriptional regulator, MarR family [Streptacidiphilus jiangxiensis]
MSEAATGDTPSDLPTGPPTGPPGESGQRIGGPVAWAVRQLLLANRNAEQALARHLGLGHNDVTAMEHLLSSPEGLGPMDIAQRLGIRSASATVLVDRLEEAGHVTRGRHRTDRRRTVVHPTPHARQEIVTALRPLVAAVDAAADDLSDGERETVVRFLQAAADRISRAAAQLDEGDPA